MPMDPRGGGLRAAPLFLYSSPLSTSIAFHAKQLSAAPEITLLSGEGGWPLRNPVDLEHVRPQLLLRKPGGDPDQAPAGGDAGLARKPCAVVEQAPQARPLFGEGAFDAEQELRRRTVSIAARPRAWAPSDGAPRPGGPCGRSGRDDQRRQPERVSGPRPPRGRRPATSEGSVATRLKPSRRTAGRARSHARSCPSLAPPPPASRRRPSPPRASPRRFPGRSRSRRP